MKKVTIYSDGACSGNPGAGGWAAVLKYKQHEKEISGGVAYTTNNRMELLAIIEALKIVKEPCNIAIYSDSAYVCNAFLKHWLDAWLANGWKTASGKSVENVDLWEALLLAMRPHKVKFEKVPGHADNAYNNRCDKLARAAAKEIVKSLEKPEELTQA